MATEYTDLLIHIHRRGESAAGYPVEARLSDGSHFTGGVFDPDQAALRAVRLDAAAYGRELFYALFAGPIRRAYDRAWGRAQAETAGQLRIRLWIAQEAASLHALLWERLYHTRAGLEAPLAVSAQTPFSRYLGLEIPEPAPIAARTLKLLYVISNPTDLAEYSLPALVVADELAPLLNSLRGLRHTGRLAVTLLPGRTGIAEPLREKLLAEGYRIAAGNATLDNLVRLLSEAGGYQLLQFVGHGALNRREGTAVLFLEDEDGRVQRAPDHDIAARLQSLAAPPALILLDACESARRSPGESNPFVGLAPQLVRAGIPAVIAMQDKIPISTARELTSDFYRYLLKHGQVDRALNEARLLLYEQASPAWASPALFMRLPAGQLFTADPWRAALTALVASPQFNPLAEGQSYIPARVVQLAGGASSGDLEYLGQGRTSGCEITAAFTAAFASTAGRRMVALIGAAGMGKSLQLSRLGRWTAECSLAPDAERLIIPVYINLRSLRRATLLGPQEIEKLLLAALAPLVIEVAAFSPQTLLAAETGPSLRVLVDGSDALPAHLRRRAWEALAIFAWQHPRHQYLIGCQPAHFIPNLLPFTDLLIMQPLSPRSVRHYLLDTLQTPAGVELYAALRRGALFDLAAYPWLLLQMLKQTMRHAAPPSHLSVLRDYVDAALAEISGTHGMRARAARTLYALAWQMQISRRRALPSAEVFRLLAEVRGRRDYRLEELVQELNAVGLLKPVGAEAWAFAHANVRAYCCAQALQAREDSEQLLDDIAATLGRHSRYRWWRGTWLLLAGLLDDPAALLRILLREAALNEGETVFLAVRCLRESLAQIPGSAPEPRLHNYLVSALLQRLDSQREPRIAFRVRAVESLAALRASSALPALVTLAGEPVRGAEEERADVESSVRLAALQALREIEAPPFSQIAALNAPLAEVLVLWEAEDVTALGEYLSVTSVPEGVQTLAAFALGRLGNALAGERLVKAFLSPSSSVLTRRNVATALTLLEPGFVTARVILPLLDPEVAAEQQLAAEIWESRAGYTADLIYLIGRLRVPHPRARAFLRDRLTGEASLQQKGLALQAVGWLYDRSVKTVVEAVAWGDFTALHLPAPPTAQEQQYLRRKALGALYYLGDAETLARLQARSLDWGPALEQAGYWAGEGIRARLQSEAGRGR
ncbi:MAG TPA: CHAT domain-containing protein [Thermoflexia bacterium]|nr:CHAT domain-containing protein [Thermoflexia bacterium]